MRYLIVSLIQLGDERICTLNSIDNVPNRYDLNKGIPMKADWPANASFDMDPDSKKNVGLADGLFNSSSLLVVSERVKTALEAIPGALYENDVHSVTIINHKGRPVDAPYFVIQQLNNIPCIDEEKSVGTRDSLDPKSFQFIDSLVIDEGKIDPKRMLFRPTQFNEIAIIRSDLAEKLEPLGLTGIKFVEFDNFDFDTGQPRSE